MANIKACMSHKSDEWSTPQDLFDRLNFTYQFNLDVCATKANAKCDIWLNEALGVEWKHFNNPGRCFMNPPHSKLKAFCEKAFLEVSNGNALFVVALLPARTDTRAFHDWIYGKADIRFIRGRLKFGGAKNSAPFPSMIVVWSKGLNK